jgi:hypothetical protein
VVVGASPREGRGQRCARRKVIGPGTRCGSSEEELTVISAWHAQFHDSCSQRPAPRTDEVRLLAEGLVLEGRPSCEKTAAKQPDHGQSTSSPTIRSPARRQPGQDHSTRNGPTTIRDTRRPAFGPTPRREAPSPAGKAGHQEKAAPKGKRKERSDGRGPAGCGPTRRHRGRKALADVADVKKANREEGRTQRSTRSEKGKRDATGKET